MADKQQTIAINHESGPALILAGPGSGKTYVLTHHLLFLINSIGVSPENILVLTFTKEAAKNMKLRFSSLCQINTEEILFGTFHSIFYKFIRLYYGNRYKIVSPTVCREYISTINSKSAYSEEILSLISKYKSKFPIPDINKFEASYEEFPDIYTEYSQILLDRNEIDYDDILLKCLEMLKQNCEFKEKIKKKFKYILIDEFQDISEVQYEIIKLITDKNSNVFAVGDEDQTIYAFRGASKDIMKRYIEDYDAVKIIELNVNYRSTLEITERAGSLISHNRGRLKRSHQSCLTSNTESFNIRYCDSKKDQIKSLLKDIKSATDKGLKCGILVRTNKDIDNLKKVIYANENSKEYEILNSIAIVFYEYLSYDLTKECVKDFL